MALIGLRAARLQDSLFTLLVGREIRRRGYQISLALSLFNVTFALIGSPSSLLERRPPPRRRAPARARSPAPINRTSKEDTMRFIPCPACIAAALMTAPPWIPPLAPAFRGRRHPDRRHPSAAGRRIGGVTVSGGSAKPEWRDHHHHGLHRTQTADSFSADAVRKIARVSQGRIRHRPNKISISPPQGAGFTPSSREDYFRHCPATWCWRLPEGQRGDKKMKRIVRTVCTGSPRRARPAAIGSTSRWTLSWS